MYARPRVIRAVAVRLRVTRSSRPKPVPHARRRHSTLRSPKIECSFALVKNRFVILKTPMTGTLPSIYLKIQACFLLHNYILRRGGGDYIVEEGANGVFERVGALAYEDVMLDPRRRRNADDTPPDNAAGALPADVAANPVPLDETAKAWRDRLADMAWDNRPARFRR
jgi:hypothetical protein